jgi:hypothetical protein
LRVAAGAHQCSGANGHAAVEEGHGGVAAAAAAIAGDTVAVKVIGWPNVLAGAEVKEVVVSVCAWAAPNVASSIAAANVTRQPDELFSRNEAALQRVPAPPRATLYSGGGEYPDAGIHGEFRCEFFVLCFVGHNFVADESAKLFSDTSAADLRFPT